MRGGCTTCVDGEKRIYTYIRICSIALRKLPIPALYLHKRTFPIGAEVRVGELGRARDVKQISLLSLVLWHKATCVILLHCFERAPKAKAVELISWLQNCTG